MDLIAPCRELAHSLGYKIAGNDHMSNVNAKVQADIYTHIYTSEASYTRT